LWAVTTLIGALSFLPGGLGATEGSLALLITELAVGVSPEIADYNCLIDTRHGVPPLGLIAVLCNASDCAPPQVGDVGVRTRSEGVAAV